MQPLMDEPDYRELPPFDEKERQLDRRIAELAGFYVEKGVLHSAKGTVMGGSYLVSVGRIQETPEVVDNIWRLYCPRFSTRVEEILVLMEQTNTRWTLRGHGDNWYTCFIGGMDEVKEKSAAMAMCAAWLKFTEFQNKAQHKHEWVDISNQPGYQICLYCDLERTKLF